MRVCLLDGQSLRQLGFLVSIAADWIPFSLQRLTRVIQKYLQFFFKFPISMELC